MRPACFRLSISALLGAVIVAAPRELSAQDLTPSVNHLYDTFQVGVAFTTVLNYSNARVDAMPAGKRSR